MAGKKRNQSTTAYCTSMRSVYPRRAANLLCCVLLAAVGCQTPDGTSTPSARSRAEDRRLNAVQWFHSAEASAMYTQNFALARRALDDALAQPAPRPRAIITDIDETVLDNSPYQVWLIQNRQPYSLETWKKWTALASATALPGASNFLNYAASRGVTVFYVTNRDQDEADATIKNLKAAGFPHADSAHLLCKRASRGKEDRRQEIAQRHTVCLLLGDNLSDLAAAFDSTVADDRAASVTNNASLFGSNWIVFPNPMYGDWEKALTSGAGGSAGQSINNLKAPKL
jgi:5'-nucleotidase (lipoprotein e(P4) family)